MKKHVSIFLLALVALLATTGAALAMTTPAAGDFAYTIYDVGVNGILKGPIGYIGGIGVIVVAAVLAVRQMILPAALAVLAAAFLLQADAIVTTLGAMVM